MKCSSSHEWIKKDDSATVTVGITAYAQSELGDIVYVELPLVGKKVQAKEEVAVLESTKAAADIYSPVSGEVVAVNENLRTHPELINLSAEDEGWICKIKLSNREELDTLMEREAYRKLLHLGDL